MAGEQMLGDGEGYKYTPQSNNYEAYALLCSSDDVWFACMRERESKDQNIILVPQQQQLYITIHRRPKSIKGF